MIGLSAFGLPGHARGSLSPREAIALLESGGAVAGSLLGYGNGRSYGDSCLNRAGMLVDMRPMNRILSFDPGSGVIEVEAGAMLSDIIAHAAPHGWFPAVVPGTRFVTVGGAIANDIHGKNHHRKGTFGAHVLALELLRSDGMRHRLDSAAGSELFAATVGGMGLTGLILSARLRLMKVGSIDVEEKVSAFDSLDTYFDMAEAADLANEYAVAWVDQLAGGARAGRGLLITGNHAPGGAREAVLRRSRLSVPFTPPVSLLNRPSLKAFNTLFHWRRARAAEPRLAGWEGFFFPLDAVGDWNRLYGPRGLFQHQSAIPFETARQAIPEMLARSRKAGQASFLTVLKRFGAIASPGLLSFPRPGYTLTLDFPNRGAATLGLLADLDRITTEAGGAVNPYKDARMPEAVFAASFPDWTRLERLRDPAFVSDFWRRTALRLTGTRPRLQAAE